MIQKKANWFIVNILVNPAQKGKLILIIQYKLDHINTKGDVDRIYGTNIRYI